MSAKHEQAGTKARKNFKLCWTKWSTLRLYSRLRQTFHFVFVLFWFCEQRHAYDCFLLSEKRWTVLSLIPRYNYAWAVCGRPTAKEDNPRWTVGSQKQQIYLQISQTSSHRESKNPLHKFKNHCIISPT